MFGSIGWVLSKLRWLQHGRVHLYVLYVGCTILALMIWYVSVELCLRPTPPAGRYGRGKHHDQLISQDRGLNHGHFDDRCLSC